MTARPGRRRPPAVVVGWAAVLVLTVGLGILGQVGGDKPSPVPGDAARSPTAPPATAPIMLPGRPPARPVATRPPIGEDGVMGGLVFGTAWSWRKPLEPER